MIGYANKLLIEHNRVAALDDVRGLKFIYNTWLNMIQDENTTMASTALQCSMAKYTVATESAI